MPEVKQVLKCFTESGCKEGENPQGAPMTKSQGKKRGNSLKTKMSFSTEKSEYVPQSNNLLATDIYS